MVRRVLKVCETCKRRRTRTGHCFICEKPVCLDCSCKVITAYHLYAEWSDRICSKRCAKQYRREGREIEPLEPATPGCSWLPDEQWYDDCRDWASR